MRQLFRFTTGCLLGLLTAQAMAASSPWFPSKSHRPTVGTVSQPRVPGSTRTVVVPPSRTASTPKPKLAAAAAIATPRSESFRYDANGNQVEHITFNGERITREYDVMNRETFRRYPDGSEIQFTYTPIGLVETMNDYRGTTRFEYTPRDHLRRVDYPNGQCAYSGPS